MLQMNEQHIDFNGNTSSKKKKEQKNANKRYLDYNINISKQS